MPPRKAPSSTKSRGRPKSVKYDSNLNKYVKRLIHGNMETKEAWHTVLSPVQLYHNATDRLISNIFACSQGTSDTPGGTAGTTLPTNLVRIGDEISPVSSTLYLQFRQPVDRPNVTYKVFVLKFSGGVLPPTSVPFKEVSLNNILNPVDEERCSIVKIKSFKYGPTYWTGTSGGSKEVSFFRTMRIKVPRGKYTYLADNSGQGKKFNIAVYVVAYDTMGTLISDNIGTCQFTHVLQFKDA